tara:strand:+ start:1229 stop:1522 length:294 start_codon:yes stop_codon:yes gene_type:complete
MTEQDIKRYLEKSKDKHIEAENLIENEHGFMSWTTWEDYLVVIQVYGDGAYWNKELDKIAKELGYDKIMMATKRNYKGFERKFGFKLTAYVLERRVA